MPTSPGHLSSGAASPSPDSSLRLLEELCRRTGTAPPEGDHRHELARLEGEQPIEAVMRAAPRFGLATWPRRMRVSDAAWLARESLPIVIHDAEAGEWIALTSHGSFRARAWTTERPDEGFRTLSRAELARRAGASSPAEDVDVLLVQPLAPAGGTVDEAAGHGGHAHAEVSPVRRLMALMRPEAPELWTIAIFSAITGLLYLALPLAVNAFISNLSFGTQSGPFLQGLVAIASVLFVCLVVAGALRALQHVVAEVVQRRIFVRLGTDIAYRLPNVDLEALDGVHAPELVNRFLDVITVQKSASMLLLTGINLVLSAAIGLTVLAFYHPFLLAFSLALVVALAAVVLIGGRRAVATSVRESRRKYEVVDWLEELARHPRVFKGAGGTDLARSRADDLVRGYLDARRDHFRILLRQISSLLALEVVAATALLAVGGWLVLNQQLTLGQLVASEIIVSAIVASISKLGKQFEAWYDAVAAMDKLGHLVDLRLERSGGEVAETREGGMRVEVRDLSYARLGRRPTFEGLSFSVAPGERVALLGTRGSGTSSVLELLLGMRNPLAGEITVDGVPVRTWDLAALRAQACILRSTDLISGTIAENVRLGLASMPVREVQRAIEAVGLQDTVRSLPDGLSTQLVTGGLPLAGRQRTRLLAARALAHRPRLLLLDELLDGHEGTLDALARALIDAPLPWTVIVATRDPRVAARCSRTIEIGMTHAFEESRHA
jgi:ABC-type bacteriocin/lantibiotic exporter with double-glycine peptidase domain